MLSDLTSQVSREAQETPQKYREDWFSGALGLPEGTGPFPWQRRLLQEFLDGHVPRSLDIPTGLGKTKVIAIWLVARALGAPVSRRLVYAVDRRAVVDQSTDEAFRLRCFVETTPELKKALGLDGRQLPISTLRGQFVDNKEWLEDPASPAIVVGTVDIIGSRLLFEGYGVSRGMRPYHAALLGVDALIVLDEAHLVPPFEKLLEAVAEGGTPFGPRDGELRAIIPPFKLMALSATGRPHSGNSFDLDGSDDRDEGVRRRLYATKRLTLRELNADQKLEDELAAEAWRLASNGSRAVRIVIFCDSRTVAEKTKEAIEKRAKGNRKSGKPAVQVGTELFVGARRVFERQKARKWLEEHGFLATTMVTAERPQFLIATSAAEVGVDLDADHMVSDLVAWERMVQRLGRVNRVGSGQADITVVADLKAKRESQDAKDELSPKTSVCELLKRLPEKDGARDASPAAIRELQLQARRDPDLRKLITDATTPAPLRPALTRPLLDAWSMTSLEEHTGRPDVQPWLRGWVDEQAQTRVVWRRFLPVRKMGDGKIGASKRDVNEFFEAAPPDLSEILEAETWQVAEWLGERAKALRPGEKESYGLIEDSVVGPLDDDDPVAIVLTQANEYRTIIKLPDLLSKDKLDGAKNSILPGATLIVDSRFGGLSQDGLLDPKLTDPPRTIDDGGVWNPSAEFRVRSVTTGDDTTVDSAWVEELRLPVEEDEDGATARWLVVEARRDNPTREDACGARRLQLLDEHAKWTERQARFLAQRLRIPSEYADALAVAARLHDAGKDTRRWQRAFNAPDDGHAYAKTQTARIDFATLDGYRHELGSLLRAEQNDLLGTLQPELRDLALHLIASHHGFAHPVIPTSGVDDAPPTWLKEREREIALRFARLQERWGPWGLAWWESLLRAADHEASALNDTQSRVT